MRRWDENDNEHENENNKKNINYLKGILGFFLGTVAAPFVAVGTLIGTSIIGSGSGFASGLDATVSRMPKRLGRFGFALAVVPAVISGTVGLALGLLSGALLGVYTGILTPFVAAQVGSQNKKFSEIFNVRSFDLLKKVSNFFFNSLKESFYSAWNKSKPQAMPSVRDINFMRQGRTSESYEQIENDDISNRYRNVSDSQIGKLPEFTETGYKPVQDSEKDKASFVRNLIQSPAEDPYNKNDKRGLLTEKSNQTNGVVLLGASEAQEAEKSRINKTKGVVQSGANAEKNSKPLITPQKQQQYEKKAKEPKNRTPKKPGGSDSTPRNIL